MKFIKLMSFVFCLTMINHSWAQFEEVGPIMGNPTLQANAKKSFVKVNAGTFDSTFIYFQDTIALPVFDDFSSNKFQSYDDDFAAPNVTFDKVYSVLDDLLVPIPPTDFYTQQTTFRRVFTVSTSTSEDFDFVPITLRIGSLASYPVTHVPTDAYPPFYIYDTIANVGGTDLSPDTIWIAGPDIAQDSATQFFAPVVDPLKVWIEKQAYHNFRFAVNPWSLGVATFDGLDEFGYPYDFGSATTNYADRLTSKPIDMSGVDASDSVYLSFLYQTEGFGDVPESSDSLILEFYNVNTLQWDWVWSTTGKPVEDFEVGHVRIENSDYFTDAFQFRFKNYGGLSGSLDHFNLDYVNLRALSGYQDTLFKDYAIVYPVNTLINDYTSVPWDHWKNNFSGKMSSNVEVVVRNGSNIAENNQDGTAEILYSGALEGNFTLIGQDLSGGNINYDPRTVYTSFHDFSTGYHYDETKPGLSETFEFVTKASAQFPNFTQNDSTITEQVFENYYAYDDGSAEKAYGPTGANARLAVQYTPYEADSLIGAQICWVPSVNDVSNELFLLTVWNDNGGQPGDTIYQDLFFFPRSPNYEYDRNLFTTYYFKDTMKVAVDGPFYIGWSQFGAERMNVGLDANIINNDKTFVSIDDETTWQQSQIPGSVMMRPIFSTGMDVSLGIEETIAENQPTIVAFPNPTTGIVTIDVDQSMYKGVEVFDLQGRLIVETDMNQIDLSQSPNGIYILKLKGLGEIVKVIKH
ncbi:MAG: T9SS type A sorting domain-containing protein [Crocinitomicaceae bacterium]|nr:T9SS type A sorting domain-containing protein [Crocinitomicaceae bacterium]